MDGSVKRAIPSMLLIAFGGCWSQDGSSGQDRGGCITIEDVIDIPPGNGVGSGFSGEYQPVSGFMESCRRCPENEIPDAECTEFMFDKVAVVTVTQNGGVLTIDDGTEMFSGAVNADGTFAAGTITSATDLETGERTGQALALFTGRFVGNRILASEIVRLTVTDNIRDANLELQSVASLSFERVD